MASSNTSSMILPPLAPKQVDKPEQLASTEPSKSAKPTKDKDEDGSGIEASNLRSSSNSNSLIIPQELAMPRTMIQRLAKSALPPSTQLQKDALLALSKSATLFINHIAGSYESL